MRAAEPRALGILLTLVLGLCFASAAAIQGIAASESPTAVLPIGRGEQPSSEANADRGASAYDARARLEASVSIAVQGQRYAYDGPEHLSRTSASPDAISNATRGGAQDVVVIGKYDDLTSYVLRPGERTLLPQLKPKLASPQLNWQRNAGVLRSEIRRGVPIRDVSVDAVTGERVRNTGFLRAERNLLENQGWTFDPKTGFWSPG